MAYGRHVKRGCHSVDSRYYLDIVLLSDDGVTLQSNVTSFLDDISWRGSVTMVQMCVEKRSDKC